MPRPGHSRMDSRLAFTVTTVKPLRGWCRGLTGAAPRAEQSVVNVPLWNTGITAASIPGPRDPGR